MNALRFRVAMAPLFLFALLFPVLAVDVVLRLLGSIAGQEIGNLVLLLFYEVTRAAWMLVAIALAAALTLRSAERRDLQALACVLLFASIAYGMFFGSGGYAGHLQERLVRALLSIGLSRERIAVLFAFGLWPTWLAVGALLRFAMLFPEPLKPAQVRASGVHDRAGVMRSVPGAGLDMGALFRGLVARGIEGGWFRPRLVIPVSCAGAIASALFRNTAGLAASWVFLAIGIAIAVTALRASWSGGGPGVRRQLTWIGRGAAASLACFLAAGIAGGMIRSAVGAGAVVVLMTLAPAPLLVGIGSAVLRPGDDAGRTTNREGSDAVAMDAHDADGNGNDALRGQGTAGRRG